MSKNAAAPTPRAHARGPRDPIERAGLPWVAWVIVMAAVSLAARNAAAQDVSDSDDPFVPSGLGVGPYAELSALMEVTIFNIDVLTLTVRVSPEAAERLRSLSEGRSYSEELADSVAALMLEAEDLWARQVLHRDVGYDRMAGGMRETTERAAEAGYISEAYLEEFGARIPDLFGFLREDGAREGDEIFFRVRGDTVRTVYRTVEGEVRLDRTVVDPEARRASVPAFFAPGTRFRRRLVESLVGQEVRQPVITRLASPSGITSPCST
jgi:hypothetical protein